MELLKNHRYQVWTDSGWSDFEGLMVMGEKQMVRVVLEDKSEIECTPDHKIYTQGMLPVQAKDLTSQHQVITSDSLSRVDVVETTSSGQVYDLYRVSKNRRFVANNMLVSNCEFIAFSETLISGQKLLTLQGANPVVKTGEIRWYEPIRKDGIYVVSLDPSMGTGGDFSAIQVLELPAMRQVAEWRHNRSRVEQQVQVLKQMLDHIAETADPENIYWSLENNGVGEAVLTVIRELDEETFPGTFMHDRRARNRRKGYTTTHRTKLDACAKLKLLVENDRIKISSKSLIHELKYFIARGNSYEASQGETDDLVMSLLVNIRMAQDIAAWEDRVTNALESNLHDAFAEDEIAPLPVMV